MNKSKTWISQAWKRWRWVFEKSLSGKDLSAQFIYFVGSEDFKNKYRNEHPNFEPIRLSKLTRKMVRSGRLA